MRNIDNLKGPLAPNHFHCYCKEGIREVIIHTSTRVVMEISKVFQRDVIWEKKSLSDTGWWDLTRNGLSAAITRSQYLRYLEVYMYGLGYMKQLMHDIIQLNPNTYRGKTHPAFLITARLLW